MVYNTMYPIRQNTYYSKNNRTFVKQKEDEETSQKPQAEENETQSNTQVSYQTEPFAKNSLSQQIKDSKTAQTLAQSSLDANIKNSTVNIAQVMKDFKNTAAAIGTPPELNEEVYTYLALVESQVTKDNPNVKLVKSNLKNAAALLDGYIAETLQRPSQVVENWLDALFLQQINYKYDNEQINPQFLVKFPEGRSLATSTEETETNNQSGTNTTSEITSTETQVTIPEDSQLKSLFVQAKKYTYANDIKKAMETFQQALIRAVEVDDSETKSKILYEIGKIYDSNDYLSQALTSYNQSLSETNDTNIKTKAHFSMAKIYDDVAEFEPAINHYLSSISYAGESENLTAQSTSLTKIGNIYTDKYNKEAFEYYSEAQILADETSNSKVKGYVSGNIGNAYSKFNEPQSALKAYSEAVKDYQEAQSPDKMAINYQKAAEVMESYGNSQKAKSLLQKALACAKQTDNLQLISEINQKLNA